MDGLRDNPTSPTPAEWKEKTARFKQFATEFFSAWKAFEKLGNTKLVKPYLDAVFLWLKDSMNDPNYVASFGYTPEKVQAKRREAAKLIEKLPEDTVQDIQDIDTVRQAVAEDFKEAVRWIRRLDEVNEFVDLLASQLEELEQYEEKLIGRSLPTEASLPIDKENYREREEDAKMSIDGFIQEGESLEEYIKSSEGFPLNRATVFFVGTGALETLYKEIASTGEPSKELQEAKKQLDSVSARISALWTQFVHPGDSTQFHSRQRFIKRRAEAQKGLEAYYDEVSTTNETEVS